MSIKDFVENVGVPIHTYKDFMLGKLKGTKNTYKGNATQISKLVKAINELLKEDDAS